jgi:hypothetical protein
MVPHALQDVCFFVLLLWPYIGVARLGSGLCQAVSAGLLAAFVCVTEPSCAVGMLMGVFYVVGVFKFALNALVGEQDKQAQE